jgi:hypothetical protein
MSLQQFFRQRSVLSLETAEEPLILEIQTKLNALGIADPVISGSERSVFRPEKPGDGRYGPNMAAALQLFYQWCGIAFQPGLLTAQQAEILMQARADQLFPLILKPMSTDDGPTRLAKGILAYMHEQGYWIARAPGLFNIVYVEGMDRNGQLNADLPDQWNDRRIVIGIRPDGTPQILVNDQATTEPGRYYTKFPGATDSKMARQHGVARIAFGQYKAWRYGIHRLNRAGEHPALVQRGRLKVHRDGNKDGFRANDYIDIGDSFYINQHTALGAEAPERIDRYSAGCLVGRRAVWHWSFLKTVLQDARFQLNKNYMFMTTVIAGDDLMRWK